MECIDQRAHTFIQNLRQKSSDKGLMMTRADKGNTVVTSNRTEYVPKIVDLIDDIHWAISRVGSFRDHVQEDFR